MTEETVATALVARIIADREAEAGSIVDRVEVRRATDVLYAVRVWYKGDSIPESYLVPVERGS